MADETKSERAFDLRALEKDHKNVHFIGIGGISMSCLAQILKSRGFRVMGSDYKASEATERLKAAGIPVTIGHSADNIADDTDLVVFTAAIKPDNPEYVRAAQKNIRVIGRAALLGAIMDGYERAVCVAGTHGKTTTTSLISEILIKAGLDPTITVGGMLPSIKSGGEIGGSGGGGSNFRLGGGPHFVVESCEYADSFLNFYPFAAAILNVEADHLDYFKDIGAITRSFARFAGNIDANGFLVINNEIPMLREILRGAKCRAVTFGAGGQWQMGNLAFDGDGCCAFDVIRGGKTLGEIRLKVPGAHNAYNALAAAAVAYELGVGFDAISRALGEYRGVRRRFEFKGNYRGAAVIDDYAHHPSEIAATLAAAANTRHNKLWCVFQPHTYSRTKALFEELAAAFSRADYLILTDIYAAREKDTGEVNSRMLAERVRKLWGERAGNVMYIKSFDEITDYLKQRLGVNPAENDLLITMGAGDVYLVGEALLDK